jgi:hypothetical protein
MPVISTLLADQRRDRHGITFLPLGRLLVPNLLAGLHVERDNMGIERGAVEPAVEDRGALVGDTAARDARRLRQPVDRRFPDLLPVPTSIATVALALVTYITPSSTSGCACSPHGLSRLRFQIGTRRLTVALSICLSGL